MLKIKIAKLIQIASTPMLRNRHCEIRVFHTGVNVDP